MFSQRRPILCPGISLVRVFGNKRRLINLVCRLFLPGLVAIISLCLGSAAQIASAQVTSTCFEHSCDGLPVSQTYQVGAQPSSTTELMQQVQPISPFYPFVQQFPAGTLSLWVNTRYHVVWAHVDADPQESVQTITSITASICAGGMTMSCLNSNTLSHVAHVDSPLVGYHPGAHLTYQPNGVIMTTNGGAQSTLGPSFSP